MKKDYALTAFVALVSMLSVQAGTEVHKIDSVHSGVGFTIRHFFTNVPGSFASFSGALTLDRSDLTKSQVEAEIEVASVNTNNDARDEHLLNDDFFSVDQYPTISFRSTSWEAAGENRFAVKGDLSIRDITREVTLEVELLGFGEGRGGQEISGWDATVTIDRRDWGITYGQGVVGNDVRITLNIQAHKQD